MWRNLNKTISSSVCKNRILFFFFLPFSFVLSSFEILFEQLFLSIKNKF